MNPPPPFIDDPELGCQPPPLQFATLAQVNAGTANDLAVSPQTLANSDLITFSADLATEVSDREAGDAGNASALSTHEADHGNPHAVTKAQVGLGSVDNVSAASLRDRSTHTGTQLLDTISDAGNSASRNVGFTSADVAEGDAPRIEVGYFGAVLRGADMSGATDARAIVQALHDSLPSYGGRIIKPPGLLRIDGTVNITKPILWLDAGSGPAAQDPTYGNGIRATHTYLPVFNIQVDGCKFIDAAFRNVNDNANMTGGAFLLFTNGTGAQLTRCNFLGGWRHVEFVNGFGWTVTDCTFQTSRSHALVINDIAQPDNGDPSIMGCTFNGGNTLAGCAAVYQQSGGGLKMVNCKVNGPYLGTGGYANGYWLETSDTIGPTGDLSLTGNSFENCYQNGIRVSYQGPANGGYFKRITILGGNISYIGGAGIDVGGYPLGGPNYNLGEILIDGVLFDTCPIGVHVQSIVGMKIGSSNYFDNSVPRPIVIESTAHEVHVDRQTRHGAGMLVENASTTSFVDYSTKSYQAVTSTTPQAVYRVAVPTSSGGIVTATANGVVPFTGEFSKRASRAFSRGLSGITLVAIGTDVSQGGGASVIPLDFDVSTSAGEILVTLATTGGLGLTALTSITVEGGAASLKIGP